MIPELAACLGVVSICWLVLGVMLVASRYKGYSHSRQFMSELGAVGSPTQKVSPLINNYPVGLVFVFFGVCLVQLGGLSALTLIGWLVMLHGVGTLAAGAFPMDADPWTPSPTMACKIHLAAGGLMTLTLFIAPLISLFGHSFSIAFKFFSLLCLMGASFFAFRLIKAFKQRGRPGLPQRLLYAVQLFWLLGLTGVIES